MAFCIPVEAGATTVTEPAVQASPIDWSTVYTLAGNCTTSFAGSSSNRVNNIVVGANRMNGLVLQPGQAASVSMLLLPRTPENGYLEAGTYLNGEVVQSYGGGICQISSTVYNAVMNAGLTVLQRSAHSMTVSYLPMGQDAAITSSSKDLVFMNPYDTPVLIQTFTQDNLLTVNVFVETVSLAGRSYRLYGVPDGELSAKTYLDCYQNGILMGTLYVGSSSYRRPKNK